MPRFVLHSDVGRVTRILMLSILTPVITERAGLAHTVHPPQAVLPSRLVSRRTVRRQHSSKTSLKELNRDPALQYTLGVVTEHSVYMCCLLDDVQLRVPPLPNANGSS
ncbi:hypothetical protein C8Q76DRAFT_14844 [Earliella scabrosa]|nr:hypothetical protein C8Q76DRAFT_14844 [Earliella scabrosa]